tara:strand:- start:123 stop:458 length:336 start_codon:yes stop_codon:yes gene_type:complete
MGSRITEGRMLLSDFQEQLHGLMAESDLDLFLVGGEHRMMVAPEPNSNIKPHEVGTYIVLEEKNIDGYTIVIGLDRYVYTRAKHAFIVRAGCIVWCRDLLTIIREHLGGEE